MPLRIAAPLTESAPGERCATVRLNFKLIEILPLSPSLVYSFKIPTAIRVVDTKQVLMRAAGKLRNDAAVLGSK